MAETQAQAQTEAQGYRGIMIKHPKTGQLMGRSDFIRQRIFGEGATRGDVSRELTKIQGRPVSYQIVYAAIKGDAKAKWEKATNKKAKGDGRSPNSGVIYDGTASAEGSEEQGKAT